jgi:hypothetical protein
MEIRKGKYKNISLKGETTGKAGRAEKMYLVSSTRNRVKSMGLVHLIQVNVE